MLRSVAPWLLAGLFTLGCGPDQRPCSGAQPNFVVVLKLGARALPSDIVVHVTYGGSGMEEYSPAAPDALHEVIFCRRANSDGAAIDASIGEAGASGDDPGVLEALRCDLWTGGFTTLEVSGTGLPTMSYDLRPRERACTVDRELVLDSPDAG